MAVRLNFEAAVGAAISCRQNPARRSCRYRRHRVLRHPSTAPATTFPDPDGTGRTVVRGMPEGRAAASVLRGRPIRHSDVDGHGHRGRSLAILASLAFGHQGRRPGGAVYVEGHFLRSRRKDLRAAEELGLFASKLLGGRGADPRKRPSSNALPSDHGAEIILDRSGDGRHPTQVDDRRRRGFPPITLVRTWRRAERRRASARGRRHRRRCAAGNSRQNRSDAPVARLPREPRRRRLERHEGGYYNPSDGAPTPGPETAGDHRYPALPSRKISIESIVAAPIPTASTASGPRRRKPSPVPVIILITYATHGGCGIPRALGGSSRARQRLISGRPQVDTDRKKN